VRHDQPLPGDVIRLRATRRDSSRVALRYSGLDRRKRLDLAPSELIRDTALPARGRAFAVVVRHLYHIALRYDTMILNA
jgi:hypothetical protein